MKAKQLTKRQKQQQRKAREMEHEWTMREKRADQLHFRLLNEEQRNKAMDYVARQRFLVGEIEDD